MGKSSLNGPFSMAMLNNRRVVPYIYHDTNSEIGVIMLANELGNHLPCKWVVGTNAHVHSSTVPTI